MQPNYATQSATLGVHADDVRTETLLGREHVVAPVTLVREMVLKGEFLPFEEIEATQLAWNAKPSTITHPTNESGDFVPASDPDQFESHKTATLFGVEASSTSRALDGEVWIDRERSVETAELLDRDDPAEMLLDGESIEVSVGYWYQRFEADGEHDGDEFDAVQVGIQPDHLALLPNGTGECSIDDGCGAGRDDATGAAMAGTDRTPVPSILQRGAQRLQSLGIDFGAACDECGGTCGGHDDGASTTDQPTDTSMNDRITNLADNSAFDAETLEEWDEDRLDALEESLDLDASGSGGSDPADDPQAGAQTDNRIDEVLAKIDDLEESVNRREQEERSDLVSQIVANSGFDEETLADYDLDALETLADEVAPSGGVYAGRAGGSQTNDAGDSDIPIGVGDRYLEEAE